MFNLGMFRWLSCAFLIRAGPFVALPINSSVDEPGVRSLDDSKKYMIVTPGAIKPPQPPPQPQQLLVMSQSRVAPAHIYDDNGLDEAPVPSYVHPVPEQPARQESQFPVRYEVPAPRMLHMPSDLPPPVPGHARRGQESDYDA